MAVRPRRVTAAAAGTQHHLGRLRRSVPRQVLHGAGRQRARPRPLLPTRPHPDLSPSPEAAALFGPVLGVIDRVVEAFAFGPTGS